MIWPAELALNLRTKIIALVVSVIVIAMAVSTYLEIKFFAKTFEQRLQHGAVILAEELAASIGNRRELWDEETLAKEIKSIMKVRQSIVQIDISALTPEKQLQVVASSEKKRSKDLSKEEMASIVKGKIIDRLQTVQDERFWDVTAPVIIDNEVVGSIGVKVSSREVDTLAAREQFQSLIITAITLLAMLVILSLFLHQTVYKPIKRLVEAMEKAEQGDLSIEIPHKGHDELASLAIKFNQMLGKIKSMMEEKGNLLQQVSNFNDALTKKIEMATEELEFRNKELQRVNATLFETQRRAKKLERLSALAYLVATVAHEIGTPLQSVSGHIQLLLADKSVNPEIRKKLSLVGSQIERTVMILQDLLLNTRQPELKIQKIAVNELLEELLSLVKPGSVLRKINLMSNFKSDLPLINGDRAQLYQVFLNLITNAMDSMPEGGDLYIETHLEGSRSSLASSEQSHIKIIQKKDDSEVYWRAKERQVEEFVSIAIKDSGPGISPENQEKIFEPFFTTKEFGKGTGLGLAISKQIIKTHKGTIEVDSTMGLGTIFTIKLPVS